jgi:hypothetical protein
MMKQADKIAAHELALFIIQDVMLYAQQTQAIIKNLRRKVAKGNYNHDLALKLWRYLADSGAKKYSFEHADRQSHPAWQWHQYKGYGIFDVATRLETARELRDHYASEVTAKANPRKRAKRPRRSERGFFPKRSKRKNPASGIRIVYNKLLGGWYVVRGPHQTPLNGRFDTKAQAQAWLASGPARRNPAAKYEYTVSYLAASGIRHKVSRKFQTAKAARSFAHNLQADFPERAAKVERIPRRNPATHIKRADYTTPGSLTARRYERARRRRLASHLGVTRLPGGGTATARDVSQKEPFAVQVKRGAKWITLGHFPFKASATDYGRALKHKYPSKNFRVFW